MYEIENRPDKYIVSFVDLCTTFRLNDFYSRANDHNQRHRTGWVYMKIVVFNLLYDVYHLIHHSGWHYSNV